MILQNVHTPKLNMLHAQPKCWIIIKTYVFISWHSYGKNKNHLSQSFGDLLLKWDDLSSIKSELKFSVCKINSNIFVMSEPVKKTQMLLNPVCLCVICLVILALVLQLILGLNLMVEVLLQLMKLFLQLLRRTDDQKGKTLLSNGHFHLLFYVFYLASGSIISRPHT